MNFKALTGSIILRRFYYVAPFGLRVLEPRRATHRLTRFSACRIEDSFVSLTALTQQRRHLIVRLYGLSVLKALQAYTPLTRFAPVGISPLFVTLHPLLTGSIILRRFYYVAPFGLRVLEPRRAAHRLTRFTCRPSGLLLLQQNCLVFFQDLRPIRSEQMI